MRGGKGSDLSRWGRRPRMTALGATTAFIVSYDRRQNIAFQCRSSVAARHPEVVWRYSPPSGNPHLTDNVSATSERRTYGTKEGVGFPAGAFEPI